MTQNPNDPLSSSESGIEIYLRNLEKTLLNREWLETRSNFELMDLVQFLAVQLYKQSTSQLRQMSRKEPEINFPTVGVETFSNYEMVPKDSIGSGEQLKVLLVGSKSSSLNRGYLLVGQAVLGREDGSGNVDIDLTEFGPEVKGVSRVHAEFQVRGEKLYVVDLDSSNGTYLKGQRIPPNQGVEVTSGSVLSFGALHVQVQIIKN